MNPFVVPNKVETGLQLAIEVYLQLPKSLLWNRRVPYCPIRIPVKDGRSLVLQVCVGIFSVHVEDDLADWETGIALRAEWIKNFLGTQGRCICQLTVRAVTHLHHRLNHLLDGVGLASSRHAEESSPLSREVLRIDVHRNLLARVVLDAPAGTISNDSDPHVRRTPGHVVAAVIRNER